MTLQLKPDTLYLARNGAIIGPLVRDKEGDSTFPWEDPNDEHWTDCGTFLSGSENMLDLIRELAPGVGEALREIHRHVAAHGQLPGAPQSAPPVHATTVYPQDALEGPTLHRIIVPDDLGDEPDQLMDREYRDLDDALKGARDMARDSSLTFQVYRLVATVEQETVERPVQVLTVRVPGGRVISQSEIRQ